MRSFSPNVLFLATGGFIQQSWVKGSHPRSMVIQDSTVMPSGSSVQHGSAQSNFSTVAIISTNSNIPTTSFTLELLHALNGLSSLKEDELGPALRLTKEVVLKELGPTAFDKAADFR